MELEEYTEHHPIVPFLRLAGYATRSKPWACLDRKLLDYLLLYVQEGRLYVQCNEVDYDLQPGDFCFVQPDERVVLKAASATITPFFHFDLFYNPERKSSFTTRPGQLDLREYAHLKQARLNDFDHLHVPVTIRPQQPNVFREKMIAVIGLWIDNSRKHQHEIQLLISELIQMIIRSHNPVRVPTNSHIADLNWITSYMTFHMVDTITLKDMAERTNLSVSRFSSIFKERFGISPYRYLTRIRIDCAKDLLQNTELRLYDVAANCGFANEQHFSKAFAKETGMTPGRYRRMTRGAESV